MWFLTTPKPGDLCGFCRHWPLYFGFWFIHWRVAIPPSPRTRRIIDFNNHCNPSPLLKALPVPILVGIRITLQVTTSSPISFPSYLPCSPFCHGQPILIYLPLFCATFICVITGLPEGLRPKIFTMADEDEWEYEYSTTETEVGFGRHARLPKSALTLADLLSYTRPFNSRFPRAPNR